MTASMIDMIIMGIGTFALFVWLIFFIIGLKHAKIFNVISEKDYPLKELYGLGYAVLESFKYKYKSKSDRVLRQEIDVIYGEKYVEFYLRVIHAQQITMTFTIGVSAFVLYGISADFMVLFIVLSFAGLSYYYFGTATKKKILKRSEEMLSDFSEVVSKLALLTNAGMILREAWEETAMAGSNVLYIEMQKSVEDMKNGFSEVDAIYGFGIRCIIPEIKKFTSTIIQGITKGNKELSLMLQQQSKEVWALKKQNIRRQGEKAASKLLIPVCIMFIGILVMILVPIFSNIGNV